MDDGFIGSGPMRFAGNRWRRFCQCACIGVCAALLAGCPCPTTATFNISRVPQDKAGLPTVLVCPGEDVTFLWTTHAASRASIDQGVGDAVPVDAGSKPWVAPREATNFQLTAVGDQCDAIVPASMHVIRDGEEYTVNMTGEKNAFLWRGLVNVQFASPAIEVTRIGLTPETAASWGEWNVQRDDVPGVSAGSSSALVQAAPVDVHPFPLVGSYQMAPSGTSSNAISTGNPAGVRMTLRCRRE